MFAKTNIINFPKFLDDRGNLSFIEGEKNIPFDIKRTFWVYDVPGGVERGGHAFIETKEVIIALSGSFDVMINDGKNSEIYNLNRSFYGLYVPEMTWRQMKNFSTNAVAVVLSSTYYSRDDYIKDFDYFVENRKSKIIKTPQKINYKVDDHSLKRASTVYDVTICEFNKHLSSKGNLTVIENMFTIPFNIKRVYYLYDIPGGGERGGHAHKKLKQLIIAVSGSFDVVLDDGKTRRTVTLNRPYYGLLLIPGIWRELNNFSSGSVCLVLASEFYDESDYIRDYSSFKIYKDEKLYQ